MKPSLVRVDYLGKQAFFFWHGGPLFRGNILRRGKFAVKQKIILTAKFFSDALRRMTLSEYLKSEGLKPSQFATALGVPASTVFRLINGDRKNPSLDLMKKIAKATKGSVTPNDFAGIRRQ